MRPPSFSLYAPKLSFLSLTPLPPNNAILSLCLDRFFWRIIPSLDFRPRKSLFFFSSPGKCLLSLKSLLFPPPYSEFFFFSVPETMRSFFLEPFWSQTRKQSRFPPSFLSLFFLRRDRTEPLPSTLWRAIAFFFQRFGFSRPLCC